MQLTSNIAKWKSLCLGFVLLLCCQLVQAQSTTTLGQEFYFAYMPNQSLEADYTMTVHITSDVTTSGNIEVIGSAWSQSFTINANVPLIIEIPEQFRIGEAGRVEQKVVYLSTQADVAAYAYNHLPEHSDATMLLPLESLDKEYLIHTYGDNSFDDGSPFRNDERYGFLVLSTSDDTEVAVTFQRNMLLGSDLLYTAGEEVRITLDRGDMMLFQTTTDPTGTEVRVLDDGTINCKKIAVFAGNMDYLGADLLVNQLYPVRDFGKEYFTILHETRFEPDPVTVLASEDNTQVDITGITPIALDRGETFTFFAEVEHYMKADKPISVLHLTSLGTDDLPDRGDTKADPFMMAMSPLKQISKDIVFTVIDSESLEQHYLSIVTPTDRIEAILDGEDISDQFRPVLLAGQYSYAVIPVEAGAHRLESRNGVVAHTYGFGEMAGAGYAIGGNLGGFEIDLRNVASSLPDGQTCVNDELILSVSSESDILTELYSEFEWHLGDGTVLHGTEVTHSYASPGDFEVVLYASKSPIACSDLTVSRSIEVMDAAIDAIVGPEAICPNVGAIDYVLAGSEQDYTYEWFADGGTITGSNGAMATVEWTYGAPSNRLKALSTSPLGCVSDTVFLDIRYNTVLEPGLPQGPASVCGDFTGVAYGVPASTGSEYNWMLEGGTVVSGQGTNQIIVDWDGPGNHRLWYTENSTTLSDVCEGTSDQLAVVVSESMNIDINTIAVSCNGQNDGAATVMVTGGAGPYEVLWNTGSQQNSISGLAGGNYEVTVTDAVGCQVTRSVTIEEPEALSGYVLVTDAACSDNTGRAEAVISGGSGNYSYRWTADFESNAVHAGLGEGQYTVTVRDGQGCELILNYSITVPQPMTATFEKERPCPLVAEGSLQILVSGGTAPYHYAWTQVPSSEENLIEDLAGGSYDVLVTDAEGCEMSLTTDLPALEPLIRLPNSFSPNGDGVNDKFEAVYNCATDFQMYIYSQWGSLIFVSNDIAVGWDGTYEGEAVPQGHYAYHIVYNAGEGNAVSQSVKGKLRLFR